MKKLIILFLLVASVSVNAQRYFTETNQTAYFRGPLVIQNNALAFSNKDTTFTPSTGIGTVVFRSADSSLYIYTSLLNPQHWTRLGSGGGGSWGGITGTLSSQTDLQSALNAKQNSLTLGTSAQYFRGNLTLGTFTTDVFSSIATGTFNSPLTFSGTTFGINQATSSVDGYLGATDFTNFLSAYNKKVTNLTVSGNTSKTITIFQQDGTQLQATFTDNVASGSSGVTSINTDTTHSQTLTTGTAGTDFAISTSSGVTTFNIPTASATNRGLLSSADWTSFNAKLANSDTVSKIATKWWAKNYTDTSSANHYVNKDSLGNYKIQTISPLHVAYNTILNNVPDTLLMDSADHTHDGYLVHADWDKLQTAYNKTSVSMSVSGFILSLLKQDGTSVSVGLPLTPSNGLNGNVQLSDGGGGFTSTNNFNIASGILGINSNDVHIRNSISGITGTHWFNSDRALMTVSGTSVGSEIYATSSFVRIGTGSNDFSNSFGGATYNRLVLDQAAGISITSQSPYGNQISLGAGTINLAATSITASGSINMGTLATGQSTSTPLHVDFGGTYSNVNGDSLKIPLFHNTLATYGLGVSSNGSNAQMDFVIGDALGDYAWYTGSPHNLVMKLTNAGILQVGSGDQTGMPSGGNFNSVFNNSASGTFLGGAFRANQTGTTSGSIQSLEGYTKTSNASGNINLSIGTIGNVEHSGAGTVSEMRGLQGGVVVKSGGTVTSAYAGYFAPTNISTGTTTVTNSYGVYIADHTPGSGTITNKYNIYAHDGNGINYFAGNTLVNHLGGNGSTPSVAVGSSVTGTVSVVGNDLGGTITLVVTSPTSLSTNAELVTLTFASTYSSIPNVVFSPANGAAISNTPSTFVKGTSTAGFSIATAPSIGSLTATTYIWTYRVAN